MKRLVTAAALLGCVASPAAAVAQRGRRRIRTTSCTAARTTGSAYLPARARCRTWRSG